ncbi:MAG: tetratricopeptide repeat protein, partial [Clostridia bacterium]|nr:tetratricopeptide repeat protein [Clostridia bacterium]
MSVIEFESNDVYYKKLYDIRKERGDLFGCITSLKSLERSGEKDFFLYYEFALNYLKMEYYTQAFDNIFKAFNYASESEKNSLYALLGVANYKISNQDLAGYYIQKFLKSKSVVVDEFIHDQINEFIEDVTSVENNFYLAYPYEKADFTKYLEKTEEVFKSGDYEKVISMLEIIPKESKFYLECLLKRSVCNFLLGNEEIAILDMKTAISIDENDVYALCNLISMLYDNNQKDQAKEYVKKLDKLIINEEDELYKVIMVNSEIGRHKKAIYYGEKYLKINEYDKSVLLIIGIAYYNVGDYDSAYKKFKKLFILTENFTSSTYLAICNNAIKYGKNREIVAVGYSKTPRDIEGSYMPCFLAGEAAASSVSAIV